MTALRKYPPEDNLSSLQDKLERLDESMAHLERTISKVIRLARLVCACFIVMALASLCLTAAVVLTNTQGANLRREVVAFGGLYHNPMCERLIDQEAQTLSGVDEAQRLGLAPCPDCKGTP